MVELALRRQPVFAEHALAQVLELVLQRDASQPGLQPAQFSLEQELQLRAQALEPVAALEALRPRRAQAREGPREELGVVLAPRQQLVGHALERAPQRQARASQVRRRQAQPSQAQPHVPQLVVRHHFPGLRFALLARCCQRSSAMPRRRQSTQPRRCLPTSSCPMFASSAPRHSRAQWSRPRSRPSALPRPGVRRCHASARANLPSPTSLDSAQQNGRVPRASDSKYRRLARPSLDQRIL